MELLSQQLGNFNLTDNFYIGCDLSNEARFLEKTTTTTTTNWGTSYIFKLWFLYWKRVICLSVELLVTPTEVIAKVLLNTIEETFAKQEILYKIGWCSSYIMDKRYDRTYLIEFAQLNISPNQKMYVKEGEEQEIVPILFVFLF